MSGLIENLNIDTMQTQHEAHTSNLLPAHKCHLSSLPTPHSQCDTQNASHEANSQC